MMIRFFILFLLVTSPAYAQSNNPLASSGQPIPRFVSLASDKVFVRSGPALRYPIKWIYQKESMPVEVIQEFDTWRKVRDIEGEEGWIHQSLLKGKRHVVVQGETYVSLLNKPEEAGKEMARLEPNVVAAVQECDSVWCKVSAEGYVGWAPRTAFWGIYASE
ncbi:MAG: SH3 domain-containing protein [Pseudomonadota bacterium]